MLTGRAREIAVELAEELDSVRDAMNRSGVPELEHWETEQESEAHR